MPINKPSQPLIPAEIDPAVLDGKADLVNGEVPADQLPSYVDDVLEFASSSEFPAEGEEGKIYVTLDTNLTYRWSGSAYIQINDVDLSNYYTKGEVDSAISAAISASLASGGAIDDAIQAAIGDVLNEEF